MQVYLADRSRLQIQAGPLVNPPSKSQAGVEASQLGSTAEGSPGESPNLHVVDVGSGVKGVLMSLPYPQILDLLLIQMHQFHNADSMKIHLTPSTVYTGTCIVHKSDPVP